MNPWLAALIPVALVVLLGGIAFAAGRRSTSLPSPPRGYRTVTGNPEAGKASVGPDLLHVTLRQTLSDSGRLLFRAPDERTMLIQYLDVGGPNSGSIYSYLRVLERDFGEYLSFAVRHLPSTEDAWTAAVALEAADKQGRFRDFLAALEDNRSDPVTTGSRENTSVHQRHREIARDLGLDLARFDADVADPRTMQQVEADRTEAQKAGVERGSTFFLLDGKSRQATSFDGFREQVADAVHRTPNGATPRPVEEGRPQR